MGGKTSTEVKNRWNAKTYKRLTINFRYDTDKELIDYIDNNSERVGITNIFRDALEMLIKSEKQKG